MNRAHANRLVTLGALSLLPSTLVAPALLRVDLAALHALAVNLDPSIVRDASLAQPGASRPQPPAASTKMAPRPDSSVGRGQAT